MLSWSTVQQWIMNCRCIKRMRRRTKKSGSTDKNSIWAKCRLAQSRQFYDQMAFPHVLEVIIENEGCMVDDLAFRSGRREAKICSTGTLKNKLVTHASSEYTKIARFDPCDKIEGWKFQSSKSKLRYYYWNILLLASLSLYYFEKNVKVFVCGIMNVQQRARLITKVL